MEPTPPAILAFAGDGHEAAASLGKAVHGASVGVRPLVSPAGGVGEDAAGVDLLDLLEGDTKALHDAVAHVVVEDICRFDELPEDLLPGL